MRTPDWPFASPLAQVWYSTARSIASWLHSTACSSVTRPLLDHALIWLVDAIARALFWANPSVWSPKKLSPGRSLASVAPGTVSLSSSSSPADLPVGDCGACRSGREIVRAASLAITYRKGYERSRSLARRWTRIQSRGHSSGLGRAVAVKRGAQGR